MNGRTASRAIQSSEPDDDRGADEHGHARRQGRHAPPSRRVDLDERRRRESRGPVRCRRRRNGVLASQLRIVHRLGRGGSVGCRLRRFGGRIVGLAARGRIVARGLVHRAADYQTWTARPTAPDPSPASAGVLSSRALRDAPSADASARWPTAGRRRSSRAGLPVACTDAARPRAAAVVRCAAPGRDGRGRRAHRRGAVGTLAGVAGPRGARAALLPDGWRSWTSTTSGWAGRRSPGGSSRPTTASCLAGDADGARSWTTPPRPCSASRPSAARASRRAAAPSATTCGRCSSISRRGAPGRRSSSARGRASTRARHGPPGGGRRRARRRLGVDRSSSTRSSASG